MRKSDPTLDVAAGWFQERVSASVRLRLSDMGADQEVLADLLGLTDKQVTRKLKGESPYSVRDLVALAIALGIEILPPVSDRNDLFPGDLQHQLEWLETPSGSKAVLQQTNLEVTEIPWVQVLQVVLVRLENDSEVPRRLASTGDLRRHLIVALQAIGIAKARIFQGGHPGVDLTIDVGPGLGIACHIGPPAAGSVDAATQAVASFLRAAHDLAEQCSVGVITALLSAEAMEGLLRIAGVSQLISGDSFEVSGVPSPLNLRLRAIEFSNTDNLVAFELWSSIDMISTEDQSVRTPRKT